MKIEFDPFLYSEKAVKKAIEDYRNIAEITYSCKNTIQCELSNSIYDIRLTEHEFVNYVLLLSVSMKDDME